MVKTALFLVLVLAQAACSMGQPASGLQPQFEGAIPIDGFIKF